MHDSASGPSKLPVPCSTRRRRVEPFIHVPRSLIAGNFARKICGRSLFSVSLFGWKCRFFAPACNCQSAARSGRQAPLARRVPRGWRALARRAPRRQGLPERALRYAQRRVERFRAVRCRVSENSRASASRSQTESSVIRLSASRSARSSPSDKSARLTAGTSVSPICLAARTSPRDNPPLGVEF